MFDRSVIETDSFLELPDSSKALYFLLGMEADDEGFCSPKRVMRLYQIAEDNLKILVAKKFVIPFKSGVVVITNWHQNNYLQSNRIKPTQYVEERKQLVLTNIGKYEFNKGLTSIEESSIEENSIYISAKKKKPILDENNFNKFWTEYPRKTAKAVAQRAWLKIKPNEKLLNEILEGLRKYKNTDQWKDPRYIPHPATFLNQRRWEDEITEEKETKILDLTQI